MEALIQALREQKRARNRVEQVVREVLPVGTTQYYYHGKWRRKVTIVAHYGDRVSVSGPASQYWIGATRFLSSDDLVKVYSQEDSSELTSSPGAS